MCIEGVSSVDLGNILDYIYNGEVQIFQEGIDRFLEIAQRLKLEGLLGTKEEESSEDFIESSIVDIDDSGQHQQPQNNHPLQETKIRQPKTSTDRWKCHLHNRALDCAHLGLLWVQEFGPLLDSEVES